MARTNVAKTLMNKQHPSFQSLNRRGDKFLCSMESGLLALSRLEISRPCKSLFTMMIMFMFGAGLSTTQAQASKYASIVIEEATGKVLFSRNADNLRYPASLTKIMTLYLLFEDICLNFFHQQHFRRHVEDQIYLQNRIMLFALLLLHQPDQLSAHLRCHLLIR